MTIYAARGRAQAWGHQTPDAHEGNLLRTSEQVNILSYPSSLPYHTRRYTQLYAPPPGPGPTPENARPHAPGGAPLKPLVDDDCESHGPLPKRYCPCQVPDLPFAFEVFEILRL